MQSQQHFYSNPFYIFFLVLPQGISTGFVSVTLPFLLIQKGFSVELAAGIVAAGISANIWRFLWGPVADISLTLRKWYWIGLFSTIITLLILCFIPYNNKQAGLLSTLVFISQIAATFVLLPVGGFMAHRIESQKKGMAGGCFQAGNLGGMGIGGGIGLWLCTHYNIIISGVVLSVIMLASGLLVLKLQDVKSVTKETFVFQIRSLFKDIFRMIRIPVALFITILVMTPIGSGAAAYLFSAIGKDWNANADTIALVTGILSGLISAVGSVAGGYVSDKWGVWWGYLGLGFLSAASAIIMAITPLKEGMYVVGVLIYSFTLGLTYAAFSAIVLFAIGTKAAATKYSLLSSLANIPVAYMTMLDGWAHDYRGSKFMLWFEGLAGIIFILLCMFVIQWFKKKNWLHQPES